MATAKVATDIKSAKINLKVCKSQVTKAIKELESSGSELDKNDQGSRAKKLRLSARMLENLEELQMKVKKMEQANEIVIQKILDTDDGELSKKKEELVSEFETKNDKYLED